ncbi:MAG: uracil phosphoribosyltransferase [Pseudomonadota bacterium]|nr:uracil phosphoribosyltransferase [Pseudomonadota bacterium]
MLKVHLFDHPLIQKDLTILRNRDTNSNEFRIVAKRITMLMGPTILRDTQIIPEKVETPLAPYLGCKVDSPEPYFVSILRAGSIIVDGLLELCPEGSVGHIGLYRDHETLEPCEYLNSLANNLEKRKIILCDPMLATGGSAIYALNLLKTAGATQISFICLLASRYGANKLNKAHPDVEVFAASLDEQLNEKGYIIPGLGDAGDRIFNSGEIN